MGTKQYSTGKERHEKWRRGLWVALWVACGGCEQKVSFPRPEAGNALSTHANGSADLRTEWVGPDTVTVAPGVHVLGRLFPSAAFAIETNDGVILIDSGVDESGRLVRSGFAEVGLQIKDLRYILLTHAHYDHVFGANKLRSISGAIVSPVATTANRCGLPIRRQCFPSFRGLSTPAIRFMLTANSMTAT